MLKLVIVVFFCGQAFARPNTDFPVESHILGGTPAKEGQFPFMVSIRDINNNEFHCGGALISDRYVLTAAHCVERVPPSWVGVGVGTVDLPSQKVYKVDKLIVHPLNTTRYMFFDIALVRLSSPITLGGNVQVIPFFSTNDQLVGKNVTAMGWGYTAENGPISTKLLYLNTSVVSNEVCQKRLKKPIVPGNICIEGELNYGTCYHDSGSPLIYKAPDGKTYVAGIVSWGIPCGKGYPDVFTRVSQYANWIKENMK